MFLVCVCVPVYACIVLAFVYVHLYVCIYLFVYVDMFVHTYMCVFMYMCVCTCKGLLLENGTSQMIDLHMYLCTCVHVCWASFRKMSHSSDLFQGSLAR